VFTFNVKAKSLILGKDLVGTVTLTPGYSVIVQVNSGLSSGTKNLSDLRREITAYMEKLVILAWANRNSLWEVQFSPRGSATRKMLKEIKIIEYL